MLRGVTAAGVRIAIGAQNCDAAVSGAHTGDVSAQMVKDAGGTWVIVGHSERRQHHGETDAMVAAKAKAAWIGGLLTMICIGETQAQRSAGQALSVCANQIAGSVPDGIIAAGNAIGYEPLWAIGTGDTPTVEQVVEVHGHIRQCLAAPEVGGALIGGASLKAKDFNAIIRAGAIVAERAQHSAVA